MSLGSVQVESEIVKLLISGKVDPHEASLELYRTTQEKRLVDENLVRQLLERYRTAEFNILNWIYEIEERQNLTGNYSPRISCDDLASKLGSGTKSLEEFFSSKDHVLFPENLPGFLSVLAKKGKLVPQRVGDTEKETVFRSQIGEMVRLILNLPVRRWNASRNEYEFDPSVSIVKYHRQIKKVPRWDQEIPVVIKDIIDEIDTHFYRHGRKYTYDGLSTVQDKANFARCVKSVLEGFQEYVHHRWGLPRTEVMLSDFQVRCIKETIRTAYVCSPLYPRDLVITAGAGSGKTFAFILGMLVCVLFEKYNHERLRHEEPRLRCLIVYPRVSLSKDQSDNLAQDNEGLLKWVEAKANKDYNLQLSLRIVSDFGGELYRASGNVYDNLRLLAGNVPDLIITNTETLRRRVKNPAAQFYFAGGLQFIIFDEVHLYTGIEGNHVSKLNERVLGRVRNSTKNERFRPMYIGASATIAQPIEHCSKIFPEVVFGSVQNVDSSDSPSLTGFGFFHHIMVKAREGRSLLGTLTDLSSCTMHNFFGSEGLDRLNRIVGSEDEAELRDLPKVIGFSDSLSVVSRWRELIRDEDKSGFWGLWPANESPPGVHTRDFPFYGMFTNPLAWRCEVLTRRAKEWIEGSISKSETDALRKCQQDALRVCENCKRGIPDALNLKTHLSERLFSFVASNLMVTYSQQRGVLTEEIRNLEECPFVKRGICWRMSSSSARKFQDFPTEGGTAMRGYADNVRTRISTSKVRLSVQNPNDEFAGPFWDVYGSVGIPSLAVNDDLKVVVPFLISSPVLEVGVDISNVRGTLLHKAIRNLSSYKQKIGRAGREKNSHALAITLISNAPAERHYFRNSFMLVDPNKLEPIALKRTNLDVLKCHALESCFDFFASLGWDVYNIPRKRRDEDVDRQSFSQRVKTILGSRYLKQTNSSFEDSSLQMYLKETLGVSPEIANSALLHFRKYMEILDSKDISQIIDPNADSLASLWEDVLEGRALPSVPGEVERTADQEKDAELLMEVETELRCVLSGLSDDSRATVAAIFGVQ